ncbi:MAG TPA: ferric reductase-like transmembrane domain-containing protein [Candidatus Thermoplasmatota archaeon]|nr:ferric reductase-like transmembrane domain-containing protein [Candidatus Thermoplasmatota archaeon]
MSRASRSVKALLLLAAIAATLFVVVGPGIAQDEELGDVFPYPQGVQEEARCMDCHTAAIGEPVIPVLSVNVPEEVEAGKPFPVQVTVLETWKTKRLMELQKVYGGVDLSQAPNLAFPSETPPSILDLGGQDTVEVPGTGTSVSEQAFEIGLGATEVSIVVLPTTQGVGASDLSVWVTNPNGQLCFGECPGEESEPGDLDEAENVVKLTPEALARAGIGQWKIYVNADFSPQPGALFTQQVGYNAHVEVYYNASAAPQQLVAGPEKLLAGEPYTFTINLTASNTKGPQTLLLGSVFDMYYKHDSNNQDLGSFQVVTTAQVLVGDKFVGGQGILPIDVGGTSMGAQMKAYSEVVGFASSFLLIPALVMGGTFGKGTVTFFNRVLGGARRRVLWHNTMSYWLLGLSLIHMVLFLIEPRYRWDVGMIWGGLSLACMIGLAVTGALQKTLVKRWGFGTWRFVHFGLGILVVGTVLLHMGLDGVHFEDVREWMSGA